MQLCSLHSFNKVIINYLDDYLFTHFLRSLCNEQVETLLEVCKYFILSLSEEKTFWADEVMNFLGFLLDTMNQIIVIHRENISKGLNMITSVLKQEAKPKSKRKVTLLQLQ